MRPVQPPDFLFREFHESGNPVSEAFVSPNTGSLDVRSSIFTFARQFVAILRSSADGEEAAIEIQRHLSHLTRLIQVSGTGPTNTLGRIIDNNISTYAYCSGSWLVG